MEITSFFLVLIVIVAQLLLTNALKVHITPLTLGPNRFAPSSLSKYNDAFKRNTRTATVRTSIIRLRSKRITKYQDIYKTIEQRLKELSGGSKLTSACLLSVGCPCTLAHLTRCVKYSLKNTPRKSGYLEFYSDSNKVVGKLKAPDLLLEPLFDRISLMEYDVITKRPTSHYLIVDLTDEVMQSGNVYLNILKLKQRDAKYRFEWSVATITDVSLENLITAKYNRIVSNSITISQQKPLLVFCLRVYVDPYSDDDNNDDDLLELRLL